MITYATLQEARDAVGGAHATIVCTCGMQLENCRCASPDKPTVAVQNGCEACQERVCE